MGTGPVESIPCLYLGTCGSRVLVLIAFLLFYHIYPCGACHTILFCGFLLLASDPVSSLLTSSHPVASLDLLINKHSFFSTQPTSSFVLSHLIRLRSSLHSLFAPSHPIYQPRPRPRSQRKAYISCFSSSRSCAPFKATIIFRTPKLLKASESSSCLASST